MCQFKVCFVCRLSEKGLALKDFPLALEESSCAKKVNIKQKCASISCQSHILKTFSISHAIYFWYAPRLPRERLLSFTLGYWKSPNLNTKNVKWKGAGRRARAERKIPESFPVKSWKTSSIFGPSRKHNRWKVTLADILSSICTKMWAKHFLLLYEALRPYAPPSPLWSQWFLCIPFPHLPL